MLVLCACVSFEQQALRHKWYKKALGSYASNTTLLEDQEKGTTQHSAQSETPPPLQKVCECSHHTSKAVLALLHCYWEYGECMQL
jgi:hypothetical protein